MRKMRRIYAVALLVSLAFGVMMAKPNQSEAIDCVAFNYTQLWVNGAMTNGWTSDMMLDWARFACARMEELATDVPGKV